MRRTQVVIAALLVLAALAAGAIWLAKRTVRWNDSKTMPPPLAAAVRSYAKGDSTAGLESVRLFLRRYRAPAWEPRARVLAATRLAETGREREILDLLPKDLPQDNPLAAHASLLRARGWLARGSYDRAAELATRAATVPGFPAAEEARLAAAQALDAGGRWREALAVLDAAPAAAAAIEAGRIAQTHGDAAGARRRVVRTLLDAEAEDDVDRLRQAVLELVPVAGERFDAGDRERLAERARHWLDEGRAALALDLLHLVRPAAAASAATPAEALIEAEA